MKRFCDNGDEPSGSITRNFSTAEKLCAPQEDSVSWR